MKKYTILVRDTLNLRVYRYRHINALTMFVLSASCCLCILPTQVAYAEKASVHYREWYKALGISSSDEKSKSVLEPLFKLLQVEVIDAEIQMTARSSLSVALKEKWGLTYGPINHRVLFHWGFNQTCKTYRPLILDIARQFKKPEVKELLIQRHSLECPSIAFDSFLSQQRDEALKYIEVERIKRNSKIISAVSNTIGFTGPAARGFATVLWDIHIMVDYTTSAKDGLLEPSRLFTDFVNQGIGRMGNFKGEDVDVFVKALNKQKYNPPQTLEIIKAQFPPLLNKYWGNTLASRGITISVTSPQ